MKLTCYASAVGTACRFEETHSLRSWAEYALTVVSDKFRDYGTANATVTVKSIDNQTTYATATLTPDPTGVGRNKRFGTLILSSVSLQSAFEARLEELKREFGPVQSEFRFKVIVGPSNAVVIDTIVPAVLAARMPGDGESNYQITVDDALSSVSKNPVQNKVVTAALGTLCSGSQVFALSNSVTTYREAVDTVVSERTKALNAVPDQFKPTVVPLIDATISETLADVVDCSAELCRSRLSSHDSGAQSHPDIRGLLSGRVSDTAFRVHAHDSVIHVAPGETQKWTDAYDLIRFHVTDDAVHTTLAERLQWNHNLSDADSVYAAHAVQTIHALASQKDAWNSFVTQYGGHATDAGTYPAGYGNLEHVATTDRSSWNSIETSLATHMAEFGTYDDASTALAAHIYETDRSTWNQFVEDLGEHVTDSDVHTTSLDIAMWNARKTTLDAHRNTTGNPHCVTAAQVNAYTTGQFDLTCHEELSEVIDAIVDIVRNDYRTMLSYKGSVTDVINLPTVSTGAKPGWAYHVEHAESYVTTAGVHTYNRRLYVMADDVTWQPIGKSIRLDFSAISTSTAATTAISTGVSTHASASGDSLHAKMFEYNLGLVTPGMELAESEAGVISSSKQDASTLPTHVAQVSAHQDHVYGLVVNKIASQWANAHEYAGEIGPFNGSLSGVTAFNGTYAQLAASTAAVGTRYWLSRTKEIFWKQSNVSPEEGEEPETLDATTLLQYGWRRTATDSIPPNELDAVRTLATAAWANATEGDYVVLANTTIAYLFNGTTWNKVDTAGMPGMPEYADVLDTDSIMAWIHECDGGDDGVNAGAWMQTVNRIIASSQLHTAIKFKGTLHASTDAELQAQLASLGSTATEGDLYSVSGTCTMYVRDRSQWTRVGFGIDTASIIASTGTATTGYLAIHGTDNTAHHDADWFKSWQAVRQELVDYKTEIFAQEVTDSINASTVISSGFYVDSDGYACYPTGSHARLSDRAGDILAPSYMSAGSVSSIGSLETSITTLVNGLMSGFLVQGTDLVFEYTKGDLVIPTLTGDWDEGIGVNSDGVLTDANGYPITDSHGNQITKSYKLNALDFDDRRLKISWNPENSVGRGLVWDAQNGVMYMPVYTVDTNGDETGLLDITDVTGIVPDLVSMINLSVAADSRYWCSAAHKFFRFTGVVPTQTKVAATYAALVASTLEKDTSGDRKVYIAGTTVLGSNAYTIALLDRFWVTGTNQFFEFQGLPLTIEKYAATADDLINAVRSNVNIANGDRYFCEGNMTMYSFSTTCASKVDDYDILKNITFATVNPVVAGTKYYVKSTGKMFQFGGLPSNIDPETWTLPEGQTHVAEGDLVSLGWTAQTITSADLSVLGWTAVALVQSDLERFGWLVSPMTYLDAPRFGWVVADTSELNTPVLKSLAYEAVTGTKPIANLAALCAISNPTVGDSYYVENVALSHNAGSQLTTATFVFVGVSDQAEGGYSAASADTYTNAVIEREFGWKYVNAGGPVADVTANSQFAAAIVTKNDTLTPCLFSPIKIEQSRDANANLVTTIRCYKGVSQLNTYGSSPTLVAGFNGDQVMILRKTKPIVGEYRIESKDMGVDQVYCRDSGLWFYRGDITPDLVFERVRHSTEKFFKDSYNIKYDDMQVFDRACQSDAVSGYLWYNRTLYSASADKVFTFVMRFVIDNTGLHDIQWTVIDLTDTVRPKPTGTLFSWEWDYNNTSQRYYQHASYEGGFGCQEFFQRITDGRFCVNVTCTTNNRMVVAAAGGHGLHPIAYNPDGKPVYRDNGLKVYDNHYNGGTLEYSFCLTDDRVRMDYSTKNPAARESWNRFKFSSCVFVNRRLINPVYNDSLFGVPDTYVSERDALLQFTTGAVQYDHPVLAVFNPFENKMYLYVLSSTDINPSEDNLRGVRTITGITTSLHENGQRIYNKMALQIRLTSTNAKYPADCGIMLRVNTQAWFFRYSHLNFEFDMRASYTFSSQHLSDTGTAEAATAYTPNSFGFDGVSKIVVTENSYIHYLYIDEDEPNRAQRVKPNPNVAFKYIHPVTGVETTVPQLAGMQPLARVGLRDGAIRVWQTTPVQAVFGKGAKLDDNGNIAANGEFVCSSYLQEGNLDRFQPAVLDFDGERTDFGGRPLKLKSLVLLSPSGRRFKFFIGSDGGLQSEPL